MYNMYSIIEELCKERAITVTEMCRELKINRSSLSELKQGRAKSLSADKTIRIADFFSVSPAYLTGDSEERNIGYDKEITDTDLKCALFNETEGITDEMFEEVKQYAEMVKLREEAKRKKK